MIVMKFGGTSVQDAAAIERLAELVRARTSHTPLVVVSAFAKVTDQLVLMGKQAASGDVEQSLQLLGDLRQRHFDTAGELLGDAVLPAVREKLDQLFNELGVFLRGVAAVRELSPRSSDNLLSFGELASSEVVAAALTVRGFAAVRVDSRTCVVTDNTFTGARPLYDDTRQRCQEILAPLLAQAQVPVMGGFIGATRDGVTTTLGRGGSDFSAAILGAVLDAERIEIWTDVEGMMTTDPRLCPEARTIRRISFNEAAELAYFGAKVLHPATLLPAIDKDIPVYVLNSRNLNSTGTRITAHAPQGREVFRAIAVKTGVALVNVSASRGVMVHNFLRFVFEALDRHGASVDLVAISEVCLSFVIDTQRLPATLLPELERIADVASEDRQAIVCLVGEDIQGKPGIAASVFGTVAAAGVNIRMISQGASEINISFVIREADVPRAITKLHTHFFPKELAREEEAETAAEAAAAGSRTENGASQRRVPRLITAKEQRS